MKNDVILLKSEEKLTGFCVNLPCLLVWVCQYVNAQPCSNRGNLVNKLIRFSYPQILRDFMQNADAVLNEEIIDDLIAILGDAYLAIFEDQIQQATAYIKEIAGHIHAGDALKASKRAHALKSSAGQVGLQSIHLLAKKLEYTCSADAEKGEISQQAKELFATLVEEYEGCVKCLYGYIANKGGAQQAM